MSNTRKRATYNSKYEQDLRKIEDMMREMNITITSYGGNGLMVTFPDGKDFWLETDNNERGTNFPRTCDEDKLILAE